MFKFTCFTWLILMCWGLHCYRWVLAYFRSKKCFVPKHAISIVTPSSAFLHDRVVSDTYFNDHDVVCFFILESYSDQNGKSSKNVGLHLLYQTETSRAAYWYLRHISYKFSFISFHFWVGSRSRLGADSRFFVFHNASKCVAYGSKR